MNDVPDRPTIAISDTLRSLATPGSFATRLYAAADDLVITVDGVGRLRFPLTATTARRLRAIARPAPFGLREQTLHDTRVRNTWEIDASALHIDEDRWALALVDLLETIKVELGLPESVELMPALDKLLLYEAGQFFAPHQDSEKDDAMIGSLVVILPSTYTGGALHVELAGASQTFRRQARQSRDLCVLAFYADCRHSVSPISSGVRAALTYHIVIADENTPRGVRPQGNLQQLATQIKAHFTTPTKVAFSDREAPPPERLVYLLDHQYTERGLTWTRLKNTDRSRVDALCEVASRLDCVCALALAEVHETWGCSDATDWYGASFDDASTQPQPEELYDSNIMLAHWVDESGGRYSGLDGHVLGNELVTTTDMDAFEPYQSEYEGYQGNYGNTIDRWYRRAAFVMWPRARDFALRARVAPHWAVEQLGASDDLVELRRRVASLAPQWRRASSIADVDFWLDVASVALRVDEAGLARTLIEPASASALMSRQMHQRLTQLVCVYGLAWGEQLWRAWTPHDSWRAPEWVPSLADICCALVDSGQNAARELASRLVAQQVEAIREEALADVRRSHPWLDLEAHQQTVEWLVHVLAAALTIGDVATAERLLDAVIAAAPPLPFLMALVEASMNRSSALAAHIQGSAIAATCLAEIETALQAPPRASDDWAIDYALTSHCADCATLAGFLCSRQIALDWPLAKDRRQHIHNVLDDAQLPVTHTTLRRGSPHVLQLRKQQTLFARERAYREQLAAWLADFDATVAARNA